jgi:quinol monooxygenase YgiN
MIFITAKFLVREDSASRWIDITQPFTEATRAEPGCLWFEWSQSLENRNEYVLVEAFADDAAGAVHVSSDHFKAAQGELPAHLQATPKIVSTTVPGDEWSELGELAVTD